MSEDRTSTGAPPVQEPPQAAAPAPDPDRTQAVSPLDAGPDEGPAGTGPEQAASHAAAQDEPTSRTTPLGTVTPVPPVTAAPSGAEAPSTPPAAASPPAEGPAGAPTPVLPPPGARPARPAPPRVERPTAEPRPARSQPRATGRRKARLVVQRVDAWSVFLFSLVASICLGVVLLVAVAALYAALSSLGVLGSLNGVLGEVAGSGATDEVVEPFITSGRVLGATAVLAAIDVVLLTALATLGALLYNLCASLTGGIEVQLGERD